MYGYIVNIEYLTFAVNQKCQKNYRKCGASNDISYNVSFFEFHSIFFICRYSAQNKFKSTCVIASDSKTIKLRKL